MEAKDTNDTKAGDAAEVKVKADGGEKSAVDKKEQKAAAVKREDEPKSLLEAVVRANKKRLGENKSAKRRVSRQGEREVPAFDLAEEIMSQQRKITATRRKAPGEKAKRPKVKRRIESVVNIGGESSRQNRIIAEIVARDIEKLLSQP